jgi:DNA-binding response OmpR family regulator
MNILLVEDEPNVAGFIKKGLEEQQFNVTVAYDGNTGLNIALDKDFDIIILDVMLPYFNGL